MEAMNHQHEAQPQMNGSHEEKSELMQRFEAQVNDTYWAYKDLVRALLDLDDQNIAQA